MLILHVDKRLSSIMKFRIRMHGDKTSNRMHVETKVNQFYCYPFRAVYLVDGL